MWLATFAHGVCSGRRNVLAQRVRDLKIDGAPQNLDSYLYQVLTGRYFKPDKKRPGKFLGSTSTLLKIVNTLRSGVLLNERVGKLPFIETETWGSIRDYVDTIRMPGAVNKFGAIFGPTGRQKIGQCGSTIATSRITQRTMTGAGVCTWRRRGRASRRSSRTDLSLWQWDVAGDGAEEGGDRALCE
jgi:hypothetical protein